VPGKIGVYGKPCIQTFPLLYKIPLGARRFAAAAFLLHLTLPLLYALFVPTLFSGWFYRHYTLANVIWYVLIALGLISWLISLVRKIVGGVQ